MAKLACDEKAILIRGANNHGINSFSFCPWGAPESDLGSVSATSKSIDPTTIK